VVPYIISIICYVTCFYLMNVLHIPHFMSSIVVAAIAIQIICAIINNRWKISTHMAAIGGTTGAVAAFALLFSFNPLWWLCTLFILAGVVGTGRMLLRLHTLGEVVGGFVIGVLAGYLAVIYS
jgi:membrane-associated phospholipid phosphatase